MVVFNMVIIINITFILCNAEFCFITTKMPPTRNWKNCKKLLKFWSKYWQNIGTISKKWSNIVAQCLSALYYGAARSAGLLLPCQRWDSWSVTKLQKHSNSSNLSVFPLVCFVLKFIRSCYLNWWFCKFGYISVWSVYVVIVWH